MKGDERGARLEILSSLAFYIVTGAVTWYNTFKYRVVHLTRKKEYEKRIITGGT